MTLTGITRGRVESVTSYLAGARYRMRQGTSLLIELYPTGTGFTPAEMRDYAALTQSAQLAGPNSALMARALSLAHSGFGRSQVMRNYLYLRVSRNVTGTAIVPPVRATLNLDDGSYSLTPDCSLVREAHGDGDCD